MDYAKTITIDVPFDEALPIVKEAFKAHGFGTLTEIDVQATLAEKIGEHVEPYVILGTCNPQLAHRALGVTPDVGLLLPCNVVVREEGGRVVVAALNADVIAAVPGLPALQPIAAEAGQRIQAALDDLESRS